MFTMRKFSVLIFFLVGIVVTEAYALQYLDPKEKSVNFKGILNDSIPILTGERVVLERTSLIATWVVTVVNLNYDEAKVQIEELVRDSIGIEQARERIVQINSVKHVDPHDPEEPLLGDGFSGFHQLLPSMTNAHEYQIISKEYNRLPEVDGYSIAKWRIGDGKEIFGRAGAIIVVQRADYSREWARDHTGIPWPFKISGTNRLVTETEIDLIDRLKLKNKAVAIQHFVPYPAYKTGSVLELMNSIVQAGKNAPP